ncbi:MAG: hypothetical protein ACRYGC_14630 [Janthinobacterium lividum]
MTLDLVPLPGGASGLRGEVAGHAGLFLFDTGGGVTTVAPATAALSGCRPWGRVTGFRATGERMDTPRCDDLRVSLGGQEFTAPTASVLDLGALMGPDMPSLSGLIALDLFAGRSITIRPLAHELVVETASSLAERIRGATEVPIRPVRDAEGVALTVDGAVATPAGRAWMELDTGNLGPLMVGEHVASLLDLDPSRPDRQPASFALVGGVAVSGPARVGRLIMDGDIGEDVLGRWDVTLDLANERAWFRPTGAATPPR